MRERILAYLSGEPLTDNFKMWVPLLESKGLLKSGAKKQIEELPDNHRIPIYRLSDWFEDDETAWAMARGEVELLKKHCLSKHRGKIEYPLLVASKHGTERLSDEPQVMVGTIHSVKGGEADVVVMFPDLSVSGMREWMAHGDPRDGVIRMFYVGMTRARETLIITQPSSSCYAQV
jgi:superfamily I DNA/RNA helicase